MLGTILILIGAIFVATKLYQLACWVRFYFMLPPPEQLRRKYEEPGKRPFAMVSGATGGIGFGFAHTLALRGFGVVLASRSESKLEECAKKIQDDVKAKGKGPAEIITVVCDFATPTEKWLPALVKACEGVDLCLLVNNVGVNNPFPQFFTDHTDEVVEDIINVNIRANTFITKALLPQMVKRNNGGAVLSFGSMFGPLGAPMLAPYSASKAYAYSFSLSLYEEYRAKGIDFLAVNPGYVMSNMSKLKKESWLITSPMTCADTVLRQLSFPDQAGYTWTATHWAHHLQYWAATRLVPERLRLQQIQKIHVKINKAAMRKKAREEAEAAKTQ
ncbi:short chain dehydrogenase, putative [Perkinsus marinus ATCC 50983]|uniref:Short chain dehydrogenase, putative n=1 Tax=Perkinsus marinus (strain ATCC 50983 / TXsc) TaxID=423536 RepID=C5KYF8_PERM5|nr:short chain dehydrogenase, putative [Perkinsus marinus ATCC 50983]EER10535.1 short chain dehydrogenase, putative [Perkinsus marinus ATCC 50983]|eukprot:XP_002778740.1 short chain dehydrogenase, putative [Perkinsus marinus ATCC 50983]